MHKLYFAIIFSCFFSTLFAQVPVISAISPASGPVGTQVTITGKNFNASASKNLVFFGGVRAIAGSGSTTSLTVAVPAGAGYYPVSILNTGRGLTGYSQNAFDVTFKGTHKLSATQFELPVAIPPGILPADGKLVDIDQDGKLDILTCSKNDGLVSIFRNQAITGKLSIASFAPQVNLSTPDQFPVAVTAADMNGDGKPDLIVTYGGYQTGFTVYQNTSAPGNISFGGPMFFATTRASKSLCIADVDGDGKPDVVYFTTSPESNVFHWMNTISVHLNATVNGTINASSFSAKTDLPDNAILSALTVADIDNDSHPDFVSVDYETNVLSVIKNTSSAGKISVEKKIDFTTPANPMSLKIGDVDGDNKPDIVTCNSGANSVSVFGNAGSAGKIDAGSLAARVDFAVGNKPVLVSLADIDGDGKPEILAGCQDEISVSMLHNKSVSGGITPASFDSEVEKALAYDRTDSYQFMALDFGDIDGDNMPDMLAVKEFEVLVLRNGPIYPPAISQVITTSGQAGDKIVIKGTNFNTNPAKNLVKFGTIPATVNSASATSVSVTVPAGVVYAPITVFDTDTRLMAQSPLPFTPTFTGKYLVTLDDFDPKVSLLTIPGVQNLKFADIDGDGKSDMLVFNQTTNGKISVYRNISSTGSITAASFGPKKEYDGGAEEGEIKIKDLNGDNKPDVIVISRRWSSYVYYQNESVPGNISFKVTPASAVRQLLIIGAGSGFEDLDLDGRTDIFSTRDDGDIYSAYSMAHNISLNDIPIFENKGYAYDKSVPTVRAMADIDGDHKIDAIITTADGTVSALQNISTLSLPKFSAKIALPVTGTPVRVIKFADLNGDGKPDMITANDEKRRIGVYKNISTTGVINASSFGAPIFYEAARDPNDLFVADMNGDGKPDLVFGDGAVSALINNTVGSTISFGSKVQLNIQNDFSATDYINVTDIDNDGKPDVVYFDGSGQIFALHNNLKPATAAVPAPSIITFNPTIAAGGTEVTVTGDNFGSNSASNIVYLGAVRATVKSATDTKLSIEVPTGSTYEPLSVLNTTTGLSGYASAPFVSTFKSSRLIDTSSFKTVFPVPIESRVFPNSITMSDIDGDGKPDVLFRESLADAYGIAISRNTTVPGKVITFAPKIDILGIDGPDAVHLADFDGDGKPDMVFNYYGNNAYVFSVALNTSSPGSISFGTRIDIPINALATTIGDFNLDGKPDIAAIDYRGALNIFENRSTKGDIKFATPILFNGASEFPTYQAIQACDLDSDHKIDLILSSGGDQIKILRNISDKGGFAFRAAQFVDAKGSAGGIKTGDFDDDGKPEIVFTDSPFGTNLGVLKNSSTTGNINFQQAIFYPAGVKLSGFTVGDLNGDGKPEIALARSEANKISVMQNISSVGKIMFSPMVDFDGGKYPESVAIGDLDADGRPDMALTYNEYSTYVFPYGVWILKNEMPAVPVPVISANGPLTFTDGKNVVLTANPGTRYDYQWAKSGVAIKGATTAVLTVKDAGSYTVTITDGSLRKTSLPVITAIVFSLPNDNFKITVTGVTCRGNTNGAITINAKQTLNYKASITGQGFSDVYNFTKTAEAQNLAAGTYTVCITVTGQPGYEQCFDVVITQPKDLALLSTVSTDGTTVELLMSGGNRYDIELNGMHYTTTNNSITLPLAEGDNHLVVTTDELCQGIVDKVLTTLINRITPYPVPFKNTLNINLGKGTFKNVTAKIFDVSNTRVVFIKQFTNVSGVLQMDVSAFNQGVYSLQLTMDNDVKIFKVIKK